jgi:hypothetical protein
VTTRTRAPHWCNNHRPQRIQICARTEFFFRIYLYFWEYNRNAGFPRLPVENLQLCFCSKILRHQYFTFIIQIMNGLRCDRFTLNCCDLREHVHKKPGQNLLAVYWPAMYWRCSLSLCVGSRPSGRDHLVWIAAPDMNGIGWTFERRVRSPCLALDDNCLTVLTVPHWKCSFRKVCRRSVSGRIPFKKVDHVSMDFWELVR